MAKLVLFNKPYGVLSQFTDQAGRETLANYIDIPKVYPAGRLDKDSEGLLLLTDDGKLQHNISDPQSKLEKSYWVQVEGEMSNAILETLRAGVNLKDGVSKLISISNIDEPTNLWPRTPPIRVRKSIPTQWLQISLYEGRNRQIRRTTAAVEHPTLRLIRCQIGPWFLDQLLPGQYKILQV